MPLDDSYAHTEAVWAAEHGGYSALTADETFVHQPGEWDASHGPYTDTVDAFTPDVSVDDGLPDWQHMWAASHAPPRVQTVDDNIDNALDADAAHAAPCGVLGGVVNLLLQREPATDANALPASTTSVRITVLGGTFMTTELFPADSPTAEIVLDGIPSGTQTLVIEALAGSTVVATGQFVVNVPTRDKGPVKHHLSNAGQLGSITPQPLAFDAQSSGVQRGGTREESSQTAAGPVREALMANGASSPPPRATSPTRPDDHLAVLSGAASAALSTTHVKPPSVPRATPDTINAPAPHRPPDAPPHQPPGAPRHEPPPDASALAGAAAASAFQIAPDPPHLRNEADPGGDTIRALAASLDSEMGGHSDGQRPPRQRPPEPTEPPAVPPRSRMAMTPLRDRVTLSVSLYGDHPPAHAHARPTVHGAADGPLMLFEGARSVIDGFHRRDYVTVRRGSLQSLAGGLTFGGNTSISPLMIGTGTLLYPDHP